MDYSPKKMNQLLEKNKFNFKKKFGQNFIIDENIIENIVKKSNIDKETTVMYTKEVIGTKDNPIGIKQEDTI